MRLFLGVDGGQSGTTAVIGGENGRVLGTGEAGPCNHATGAEGRAKLEGAISGSVGEACRAAGLDPASLEFECACFGMSGGHEDKHEVVRAIIKARQWIFTNDAVIALAGATEEGQGIIVIAGTGSISFGRNATGKAARAGGWGYVFGDEGGAFDIARQGLRATLRMAEGWGPPTSLHPSMLAATGASTANDMLHLFYTPDWPRSRVAKLAPLVDQAAMAGDAVAEAILSQAAQTLASLVAAVRSQLWQPGDPVEVAAIGGVFESRMLRQRFRMLVELSDANRCRAPRFGPGEGALLEAYRAAGIHCGLTY
jgi:N-acetylglucosamine kinase-like BadF-type ATPase